MLGDSLQCQRHDRSTRRKGLGRLRWYCSPCGKPCYTENAFKQHTLSKSHVREIVAMGPNAGRVIKQLSQEFQSDFLNLLRLNHREKSVHVNQFYQEYIADRHHVHINATRWHSQGLTRFARWLGLEGLCRVEEKADGLYIAWIDNCPDNMRRAAALEKKERVEAAGRRQEERQLGEQVKRAHAWVKRSRPPPVLTYPAPLDPPKFGDTNVTFRLGRKADSAFKEPILQPRRTPDVFKTAGRKRERPVDETKPAESLRVEYQAIDRQRA